MPKPPTHLPIVQHNVAMLEGSAVKGQGLILSTLATHIAPKLVPQATQVGLQLPDGLAQVLMWVQAKSSHLHSMQQDIRRNGMKLRVDWNTEAMEAPGRLLLLQAALDGCRRAVAHLSSTAVVPRSVLHSLADLTERLKPRRQPKLALRSNRQAS